MKFFHLADLHIGKKVNQYSMLADQRFMLEQVLAAIDEEKPQVIILAGDIYDRRNPGVEAIDLLDWFISEVVIERHISILAIGGNHDSGERLNFANGVLARAGLHLAGALQWPIPVVRFFDADGAIDFHLLPYADLAVIQHLLPDLSELNYAEAMAALFEQMELANDARHVLVAHGVVLPPTSELIFSDSERDLSIGGTECWSHEALGQFHYVALGHLHRAQNVGSERIRYAGSPIKYSFSEETHQKIIQVVSLDGDGRVSLSEIPLKPLHDMRTVRGLLNVLLETGVTAPYRNDYLRVILEDKGEILDPMLRLRSVYPNVMALERLYPIGKTLEFAEAFKRSGEKREPLGQLEHFYESLMDERPSEDIRSLMKSLIEGVHL